MRKVDAIEEKYEKNQQRYDRCFEQYDMLERKCETRFGSQDIIQLNIVEIEKAARDHNELNENQNKNLLGEIEKLTTQLMETRTQMDAMLQNLSVHQQETSSAKDFIIQIKNELKTDHNAFVQNYFSTFQNIEIGFNQVITEKVSRRTRNGR